MKAQKIFILLVGLSLVIEASAQNRGYEIRDVKPFNGIKVSTGINLYLKQGNDHSVAVEADEQYINNIITDTKGGVLNVYFTYEGTFKRKKKFSKINVYVTVEELEIIETSSGADVFCENCLKIDKLTVKSSSGSDASINIDCRELSLYASSCSDIKAKGSAISLIAKASSGSDINARELEAVFANLTASSGSDIVAKVSTEIEAYASSGGDIVYYGNAIPRIIRHSSGGEVTKR
jgi:hypothetical protein